MRMKCFAYVDGNASSIILHVCRKEKSIHLVYQKIEKKNNIHTQLQKKKNTDEENEEKSEINENWGE